MTTVSSHIERAIIHVQLVINRTDLFLGMRRVDLLPLEMRFLARYYASLNETLFSCYKQQT